MDGRRSMTTRLHVRALATRAVVTLATLTFARSAEATCEGGGCHPVFVGGACEPLPPEGDGTARLDHSRRFYVECTPLECSAGGERGSSLPTAAHVERGALITPEQGV